MKKPTAAKRKAPVAANEIEDTTDAEVSEILKSPTKDSVPTTSSLSPPNGVANETFADNAKIFEIDDKPYKIKICSWNVAGLRALVKKNGMDFLDQHKPDIFCMQVEFVIFK